MKENRKTNIWYQLSWLLLLASFIAIYPAHFYKMVKQVDLAWGGSRPAYKLWAIMIAPIMFFSAMAVLKTVKVRFISPTSFVKSNFRWVTLLVSLIILEAINGIVIGNPSDYLIGDTFKYILFPFGFIIFYLSKSNIKNTERLLLFIALLSFIPPGLGVGTSMFLFSYLLAMKGVFPKKVPNIILIIICLYTISIGKTTLIVSPFLLIFAASMLPNLNLKRIVIITALVVLFCLMIWIMIPDVVKKTGAFQKTAYFISRLNLADYSKLDKSTYQRIQEVILVKEKFSNKPFIYYLIGFGNGAVYDAWGLPAGYQELIDVKFKGKAHHIHISPVFIFHQWGIIGLFLAAYFLLIMFKIFKAIRGEKKVIKHQPILTKRWFFISVASFLMLISFVGYGFFNPPKKALLYAGMLLGLCSRGFIQYKKLKDQKELNGHVYTRD